jgi:GAF domain-containing protein/HAMP domain-containing protein
MAGLRTRLQSRRWLRPTDWSVLVQVSLGMAVVVILASSMITYANMRILRAEMRKQTGVEFATVANNQMAHLVDILSEQITVLRGLTLVDHVKVSTATANANYSGDPAIIQAQLLSIDEQWQAATDDDPLIQAVTNPESNQLTVQLLSYRTAFPDHVEILLTDRYGGLVAATGRPIDYYQADENWWQMAYNRGRGAIYISQPYYDETSGSRALSIAVPITAESGDVIGIAHSMLNVDTIYRVVDEMGFGETGHVTLVDSNGYIIADTHPAHVSGQAPSSWVAPENMLASDRWHEGVNDKGIPSLIGHATIAGTEIEDEEEAGAIYALAWILYVHQTQEEADRPVTRVIWTGFLVTGAFALGAVLLALLLARGILIPITNLVEVARQMAEGDLGARAQVRRRDEIGKLGAAFNSMANEIVGTVGTLEQRIAERTRGLQATVEVSRAITSMLDPDELLQRVVGLARDRLDLYYVGLFLVDEERRYAVLRAGTGEAGRQMVEQGHRLEIGGQSMIGQEAVRFSNPFLPETRSEMALPLRSRGQVIGAMTVQSTEEVAFDETDVAVLQAMADQVAVALDNARLFANAQAAVEEMEATHRRYLGRTWSEYLQTARGTSYEAVRPGVDPIDSALLPELERSVKQQSAVTLNSDGAGQESDHTTLAAPIVLRGAIIGALGIRDDDGTRQWSEDEIALVEAVAERLGLAAENLRLIEETQRRAAFDRLVSQVTARVRETLDIDTMLKTAAQEVRQALDLPEVVVRLTPPTADGAGDGAAKQNSEIPYRGRSSDGGNDA